MNRLQELREERNISLSTLSKELEKKYKLKIGKASLNNYERGLQSPKSQTWEKLADFFQVPTAYIMGLSTFESKFDTVMYDAALKQFEELIELHPKYAPSIRKAISDISSLMNNAIENEESIEKIFQLLSIIKKMVGRLECESLLIENNNREENEALLEARKELPNLKEYSSEVIELQNEAISIINYLAKQKIDNFPQSKN